MILPPKKKHGLRSTWIKVYMDHAHAKDIGLFLIPADSFSGWHEVIKVSDRKATTGKQLLKTVFTRKGINKTIVTDNIQEFCDS